MQKQHLENLASRPNTTVMTVEHDVKNDPWPVSRLRPVMESIMRGVTQKEEEDITDFALRKRMLEDPETLAFQRQHPQLYWVLTDRAVMREQKSRDAITALLRLRTQVERGEIPNGHEADAAATNAVMTALMTE